MSQFPENGLSAVDGCSLLVSSLSLAFILLTSWLCCVCISWCAFALLDSMIHKILS